MRRQRLLIVLVLGLFLAGGAIAGWQARGQARLVERDLAAARELLGQAGGFSAGQLEERLVLIDRAEAHTLAAERRLDRPTLRLLGALPLAGRDVRVARVVAASATGTVRSTAKVVTALQPIQAGPPTGASIRKAADALGGLHRTLEGDLERVRAARPLLAGGARDRYLKAAAAASATAGRAGQALELAAGLYGPPGTTRWFLALQNPAELRGTGGLIGEYGILESSPSGPRLAKVAPYEELDHLTTRRAEACPGLAASLRTVRGRSGLVGGEHPARHADGRRYHHRALPQRHRRPDRRGDRRRPAGDRSRGPQGRRAHHAPTGSA